MSKRTSKTQDRIRSSQKLHDVDSSTPENRAIDQKKLAALGASSPGYQLQYYTIAEEQQRADPSNPFTFRRVYSQLMNGVAKPGDFNCSWRKESRTTLQGSEFVVSVPFSMTHP